jgi:hypothetical protein
MNELPSDGASLLSLPDESPAAIVAASDSIQLTHRRFVAEIDFKKREGRLHRQSTDDPGLDATIRVALCTLLPGKGGLPLHAAGIVMDDLGIAFFGPSGAGKSTLASSSPWQVLSDELVAIVGQPPMLHATGVWGTSIGEDDAMTPVPLLALVEITKASAFSWERLAPSMAFRRLIGSSLVPAIRSCGARRSP